MDKFVADPKDPQAILDYSINWSSWLVTGDSVTTSSWAIEAGVDAALVITQQLLVSNIATVWVSGGTLGKKYKLTNTINTVQGRRDQRTFVIPVKDN